MNRYLAIVNYKTFIAVLISILTPILAYYYNINYSIDLTLISIAIVFPLVFTIRSSFRRREKALEHLSQFRGAIKTVEYLFLTAIGLPDEKKNEISNTYFSHVGRARACGLQDHAHSKRTCAPEAGKTRNNLFG